MKKVSVIIVNFNTKDSMRDCLNNLNGIYPNLEIIVVDNASADGSQQMMEKEFPGILLIKNDKNYGLAYGYNRGIEKSTGDYLLYLGTDAFPGKETISGMVDYIDSRKEVGAATCKLMLRDGTVDMDAHRGFPTPWSALTYFSKIYKLFPKSRIFNRYFIGWENPDTPHEIDLCIAHFMLVKKAVQEKVGLWDQDYFLYGEDVDMCYRIKEAGWKILYLPQWSTLHYKGLTVGVRKTSADITKASAETLNLVKIERSRARELFYSKHLSNKYPAFVTKSVLHGMNLVDKLRK